MPIIVRNMAKVSLPEDRRIEILGLYSYESYGGKTAQNYVYKNGIAYLPLNTTKLKHVADLLGETLVDERSAGEDLETPFVITQGFTFRPHQEKPAYALLHKVEVDKYAVLQGECGSGKTFVNTWVAGNLQRKVLVLVDQNMLAVQWQEAFKVIWGKDAQLLDQKSKGSYADVVIATFQFLHRNPEVVREIKEIFGTCVVDEYHTSAADTYKLVLMKLNNKYRIGTSATVMRKGFEVSVLTDLIADVSVVMKDENALIPTIEFMDTGIAFQSDNPDDYSATLSEIAENNERNTLIISLIAELASDNRVILFVGARTASLKYLHKAVSKFCNSALFVGTTTAAQDQALKAGVENGSIQVVFSEKKLEKGTDLPRLDTLILAKPMNNEATVTQLVGRVLRCVVGKPTPRVIDLVDRGELACKWANNRRRWYAQRKYVLANTTGYQRIMTFDRAN